GNNATSVQYTSTGTDYAEYFQDADVTDHPNSGEAMSFGNSTDAVKRSSTPNDQNVLGITSTNAGVIGGGPVCQIDDDNCDANYASQHTLVALNGQVHLNVTDENGPVQIGDFLTTSSTPG